jgi:hypothetical protein
MGFPMGSPCQSGGDLFAYLGSLLHLKHQQHKDEVVALANGIL